MTAATLTAPADGLIIAVNVLPGVNAPTSGYAIEESVGPMVANASFAESDIANLQVGQTASVSVTGAGVSVPGTLTQIVPVASSSSGASSVATYAVTVTLTSPPATVLAGMSATVTVTTASVDNVLRVPATALAGSARRLHGPGPEQRRQRHDSSRPGRSRDHFDGPDHERPLSAGDDGRHRDGRARTSETTTSGGGSQRQLVDRRRGVAGGFGR